MLTWVLDLAPGKELLTTALFPSLHCSNHGSHLEAERTHRKGSWNKIPDLVLADSSGTRGH